MKGITVNEALELLKPYGVILVAGGNGLSNCIESLNIQELSDYHTWVHGGELYLTTLQAFGTTEEIYDMIRTFARAKVAALAVHPGNNPEVRLDKEAYRLANETSLPILLLPRFLPYSIVITVVEEAILNKQKMLLERSQMINQNLTNILLEGGGYAKIAQSVQKILNKPVIIVDSFTSVRAIAGPEPQTDILLRKATEVLKNQCPANTFLETTGTGNKLIHRIPVQIDGSNLELVFSEICVGEELFGYVIILVDKTIDEEEDIAAVVLTHAATAAALEENKQRAIRETQNKDFLEYLLHESFDSEETLVQRAKRLGFDLKGKRYVLVMDIDQHVKDFMERTNHFRRIKNRIFNMVEHFMGTCYPKSIMIRHNHNLVLFPHFEAGTKTRGDNEAALSLAHDILNEVNKLNKEITVSVGIGGYCKSAAKLALGYRQAKQALTIGRKVKGNNHVFDYQQLGVYSLLSSFGSPKFECSCREILEVLLEYDRIHQTDLIKTMEAYLDSNESIVKTAEKFFVHPNTVKYRLERIKEILGKDPFENGEEKLYYHISLKAIKIL